MSSLRLRRQLFDTHVADLNGVFPGTGDVFVCPICLGLFDEADLLARDPVRLDTGHVWAKDLRKGSAVARRQRVLLCKPCNSEVGSRLESQMQLWEETREGEETGRLGERRIQLIENPGEPPIDLRASVTTEGSNAVSFSGDWSRAAPRDRERFERLVREQRKVDFIIHPRDGLKTEFVEPGWITSAYLTAFFTLGYRYILNESLEPVREYISRSIEGKSVEEMGFEPSPDFDFQEYRTRRLADPELAVVIPGNPQEDVRLEVSYRMYQVRLPFRCVELAFAFLVHRSVPNYADVMAELQREGGCLRFPICCPRLHHREPIFDYIMGKPIGDTSVAG